VTFGIGPSGIGGGYCELIDSLVHSNGVDDFDHGCYMQSGNNLIDGNSVYDNTGWGITFYNGSYSGALVNNIVRNNKVYDNAAAGDRGVGIHIGGGSDNLVYNNLIWGNNGGMEVAYGGTTDNAVYNNTIWSNPSPVNNKAAITVVAGSTGTVIRNNILYANYSDTISDAGSGTTESNNITANPNFVSTTPADPDFLKIDVSSTAVLDVGYDLSGIVDDDFMGTARPQGVAWDVGAYELRRIYYVAKNGNDGNLGSEASPKLTIAAGLGLLSPGSTLYIKAGTYSEYFNNTIPGGTSWANAVTIAAFESDVVTINGGGWFHLFFIEGADKQYIIFDKLVMDAANVTTNAFKTSGGTGNAAHHIRVQNCEIKNAPSVGILTTPLNEYLEFLNCDVHHNGAGGPTYNFYIQGNHTLIEGCDIYNSYRMGGQISTSYPGVKTEYNIVRNCRIHNCSTATPTAGWIIGDQAYNNYIYNNLIYDNNGDGIQINVGNNYVYNNTIYNNSVYAIEIGPSYSNGSIIKNNIFWQNDNGNKDFILIGAGSSATVDNNTSTNPFFEGVGDSPPNFHLTISSIDQIDKGVTIPDFDDDFDGLIRADQGIAWDIGAYEILFGGSLAVVTSSSSFSLNVSEAKDLIGPPNETILKSNFGRGERYKRGRLQKIYWFHNLAMDLSATPVPVVTIEISADNFGTIERTYTNVPNIEGWNSIELWFNTLSPLYRVRISDPTRAEVLSIGPAVFEVVDTAGVMGSI
jgi:hypothetical protein